MSDAALRDRERAMLVNERGGLSKLVVDWRKRAAARKALPRPTEPYVCTRDYHDGSANTFETCARELEEETKRAEDEFQRQLYGDR